MDVKKRPGNRQSGSRSKQQGLKLNHRNKESKQQNPIQHNRGHSFSLRLQHAAEKMAIHVSVYKYKQQQSLALENCQTQQRRSIRNENTYKRYSLYKESLWSGPLAPLFGRHWRNIYTTAVWPGGDGVLYKIEVRRNINDALRWKSYGRQAHNCQQQPFALPILPQGTHPSIS